MLCSLWLQDKSLSEQCNVNTCEVYFFPTFAVPEVTELRWSKMSIAASKQQCLVMYPLRTAICGLVHIISTVSVTLCGKRWGDVSTEKIWRVCLTATWRPWRSFCCGSHADLILIAIETIPTLEHMWLVTEPSQVGKTSDYWNSDESGE